MSNYQFGVYEKIRDKESKFRNQQEKQAKKGLEKHKRFLIHLPPIK